MVRCVRQNRSEGCLDAKKGKWIKNDYPGGPAFLPEIGECFGKIGLGGEFGLSQGCFSEDVTVAVIMQPGTLSGSLDSYLTAL